MSLYEVRTQVIANQRMTVIIVRYGSQVVEYLSYDQVGRLARPNPMCTVFPTVTR